MSKNQAQFLTQHSIYQKWIKVASVYIAVWLRESLKEIGKLESKWKEWLWIWVLLIHFLGNVDEV